MNCLDVQTPISGAIEMDVNKVNPEVLPNRQASAA